MSQSSYIHTTRIGKWGLRKIFNDDKIMERIDNKELDLVIVKEREVPEGKVANCIEGTMSQELKIFDGQKNLISKAHRYLRPDGKLAASGLVDPKRVMSGGVMYILDESIVEPEP